QLSAEAHWPLRLRGARDGGLHERRPGDPPPPRPRRRGGQPHWLARPRRSRATSTSSTTRCPPTASPRRRRSRAPRPARASPTGAPARWLVLGWESAASGDARVRDLGRFPRAGDCLVVNDTRVLPARLLGRIEGTPRDVEVLLLHPIDGEWAALLRPARRCPVGT